MKHNKLKKSFLAFVMLSIFISSCSENHSGGSVETENVLKARVVFNNDMPAVGAKIEITEQVPSIKDIEDENVSFGNSVSNDSGYFEISINRISEDVYYSLKIEYDSLAALKDSITGSQLINGLMLGDMVLEQTSNLRIIIRRPNVFSDHESYLFEGTRNYFKGGFNREVLIEKLVFNHYNLHMFVDKNDEGIIKILNVDQGDENLFWYYLSSEEYVQECNRSLEYLAPTEELKSKLKNYCLTEVANYNICEQTARANVDRGVKCFEPSIQAVVEMFQLQK